MSADNWMKCPKCVVDVAKKDEKRLAKIHAKYGKVEASAFVEEMAAYAPTEVERTMREDYEQGMDEDGVYTVDYRASCNTCGFYWEFKHSVNAFAETRG